jgi:hypothetical protein
MRQEQIKCLKDMYNSDGFMMFDSDRRGNDMFINDPDRADRCYKAAENGSDGSYHAEIIQDWRDYLEILEQDELIPDYIAVKIDNEINDCEQWHEQNGSLWQELS